MCVCACATTPMRVGCALGWHQPACLKVEPCWNHSGTAENLRMYWAVVHTGCSNPKWNQVEPCWNHLGTIQDLRLYWAVLQNGCYDSKWNQVEPCWNHSRTIQNLRMYWAVLQSDCYDAKWNQAGTMPEPCENEGSIGEFANLNPPPILFIKILK